jgi:hypothetical protein
MSSHKRVSLLVWHPIRVELTMECEVNAESSSLTRHSLQRL